MTTLSSLAVKASTKMNYFASFLAAKNVVQLPITHCERQQLKNLKKDAHLEPINHPVPMTALQLQTFCNNVTLPPEMRLAVAACWCLAQRISDVLLWRAQEIRLTNTGSTAITVREGKTIAHTGPYTLFLPAGSPIASQLLILAKYRQNGPLFKFCDNNLLHALRTVSPKLERRSIRRGGAVAMANAGIELDVILEFTRHASKEMLFRYIGYGLESTALESKMNITTRAIFEEFIIPCSLARSSLLLGHTGALRYTDTKPPAKPRAHYTPGWFDVEV